MHWSLIALLWASTAQAAPLVLQGEVPADGEFFTIPFDVPAGTAEIEVRHDDLSSANILDWGLIEPSGKFRGWGGGNSEPIVVAAAAASRSYLAGTIDPGTWKVLVGKARVTEKPGRYRVEIELRTTATLAPQVRTAYADAPALSTGPRWYAGDLHVHSLESGDARPSLEEIAAFARNRGLDFVALSDHNTVAHLDFFAAAQRTAPSLLLVPSVEFTTYQGHANAFGATKLVPHTFGLDGWTFEKAVAAFADQGAVLTINHPTLDLGGNCIGCAWQRPLPKAGFGAIEVGVGGWDGTGSIFDEPALAYWEALADKGLHLAAVGGSDDHRAGQGLNQTQSPIGDPTTLIFARELSVPALLEGLRDGRTVVKLRGPGDPMIELSSDVAARGDTVIAASASFTARVTGGVGTKFRWVINGAPQRELPIEGDDVSFVRALEVKDDKSQRLRAEVLVAGKPRTVTSHLWLSPTFPAAPPTVISHAPASNGCSAVPISGVLLGFAVLMLVRAAGRARASAVGRAGETKRRHARG